VADAPERVERAADHLNALISEHITGEQLDTFLYVLGVLQTFEAPTSVSPHNSVHRLRSC